MSMRSEKNWGVWTPDFRPDFTAAEAGLDACIHFGKDTGFVGRSAALEQRDKVLKQSSLRWWWIQPIPTLPMTKPYSTTAHALDILPRGALPTMLESALRSVTLQANSQCRMSSSQLKYFWEMHAAIQSDPLYDPAGEKMRA